MKTNRIILLNTLGFELAAAMHQFKVEKVEVVAVEQKEQNQLFSDEALRIKNYELEMIQCPNYYEQQPSKFISKPKNNFKRR